MLSGKRGGQIHKFYCLLSWGCYCRSTWGNLRFVKKKNGGTKTRTTFFPAWCWENLVRKMDEIVESVDRGDEAVFLLVSENTSPRREVDVKYFQDRLSIGLLTMQEDKRYEVDGGKSMNLHVDEFKVLTQCRDEISAAIEKAKPNTKSRRRIVDYKADQSNVTMFRFVINSAASSFDHTSEKLFFSEEHALMCGQRMACREKMESPVIRVVKELSPAFDVYKNTMECFFVLAAWVLHMSEKDRCPGCVASSTEYQTHTCCMWDDEAAMVTLYREKCKTIFRRIPLRFFGTLIESVRREAGCASVYGSIIATAFWRFGKWPERAMAEPFAKFVSDREEPMGDWIKRVLIKIKDTPTCRRAFQAMNDPGIKAITQKKNVN